MQPLNQSLSPNGPESDVELQHPQFAPLAATGRSIVLGPVPLSDVPSKRGCEREVCCCCCWRMPIWKCCPLCLVATYILAAALIFPIMQGVQFPGNIQGDDPSVPLLEFFNYTGGDGRTLQGCVAPATKNANSCKVPMLFFGGNAQGMVGAVTDARVLLAPVNSKAPDVRAFTTAYRGYYPNVNWITTQREVVADAQRLLDHALSVAPGNVTGKVLIAGWSMGAGVAMQLAAARPEAVAGLLVIAPWSSLRTETLNVLAPVSYALWPWIWESDRWDSVAAAASLPPELPLAVLSSGADTLIRPWQHRRVYDAAPSSRKWWLQTPSASHVDIGLQTHKQAAGVAAWLASATQRLPGCAAPQSNLTRVVTWVE